MPQSNSGRVRRPRWSRWARSRRGVSARGISLVHVRLDQRLVAAIEVARVEIAGGEIEAAPFVAPLSPPAVNAKLQIRGIGLADVVALVPAGVSEARGRVDGELQLGWSKALGLQVGAGRLDLRPDEPMVLRLVAAPGLLSANMPSGSNFCRRGWGRSPNGFRR